MRKAKLLQQRPHIALVIVDAEAVLDYSLQIDPPPAYHPVNGTVGADFNDPGKFLLLVG